MNLYYPLHTPGADKIFPLFNKIKCIPYNVENYAVLEGKDIDILVANTRLKVNTETITRFPSVEIFATISTGVDHVNFEDLKHHNKKFINSPGANASSVAEYCIVSMLHYFSAPALQQETVGIIGYGHTGRSLAKYLDKYGVRYKKFDPKYPLESDPLDEVLACGIVSFHVSLTKDGEYKTGGMVDQNYFAKMKHLKMILNTSRGEIFTSEVFNGLTENRRLFKVIDVFSPEPVDKNTGDRILQAENLIVSPHIAGYSQYGRISGTYRLAVSLAKIYHDTAFPPIDEFLEQDPALKTDSFLTGESDDLKNALQAGDYSYFEKRRNAYPARKDMFTDICP